MDVARMFRETTRMFALVCHILIGLLSLGSAILVLVTLMVGDLPIEYDD